MSLTVVCRSCVDPQNARRVVQWRTGPCRDCCDDFVARHLLEHPTHRLEVSGHVSDTPFDVPKSIRRLFDGRAA